MKKFFFTIFILTLPITMEVIHAQTKTSVRQAHQNRFPAYAPRQQPQQTQVKIQQPTKLSGTAKTTGTMPGVTATPVQQPPALQPEVQSPAMQSLPPDFQALLFDAPPQGFQPLDQPQQPFPAFDQPLPPTFAASPTSLPAQQQTPHTEQAKLAMYKKAVTDISIKSDSALQQKIINDFGNDVLNQALESKQLTINALLEIQKTLDSIIVHLKTLLTPLRSNNKMQQRLSLTTSQISMLTSKKDDLARKINQLNKIANALADANKIAIDNLQEKVTAYRTVLSSLTKDTPDHYIQELTKDLYALVTAVRGQEQTKVTLVKQLLNQATAQKTLTKEQILTIKGLNNILTGQTTTQPILSVIPPSVLKNKIAEIQKKQTIFEKIVACREALGLLGDATAQADKNSLVNLLKDLMQNLPNMKKAELAELRNLFFEASKNPFLLAPNQQPIMDRWLQIATKALVTIDNVNTLLISIKNTLDASQNQYSNQLETCYLSVVLLTSKISPAETNQKSPASLTSKVRNKINFLFLNRSNKSFDDMTLLKNIFGLAKQVSSLANMISPQWQNDLAITLALSTAETKSNVLEKLKDLDTVIKLLSNKTDIYERRAFITTLTNIFSSRKDRAIIELTKFKDFLATLTVPQFVSKNIFDKASINQINEWKKTIESTLILLESHETKSLSDQIKTYQSIIKNITAPDTDYEKTLFTDALSKLFVIRGELTNKDLVLLRNFFKTVQTTPQLLAPNQQLVFNQWVQDLESALAITRDNKTYLESLAESAVKNNDLTLLYKTLDLFTPSTPTGVKNTFVSKLNDLFTQRNSVDRAQLLAFFKTVGQKKIGLAPLLNLAQMKVLKEWENALVSGI